MAGRPPKPEALRAIEGYRDKAPPRKEPRPKSTRAALVCPKSITDPADKRTWRKVAKLLREAGMFTDADVPLLEQYVTARADRRRLREAIGDQLVATGCQGNPIAHPLLSRLNQTEQLLVVLSRELGMTALARARLGVSNQRKESDGVDSLRQRGRAAKAG